MKTKLLFAIAFLITLQVFAQTNGWYLYTKASTIYKIVPDDANANELHLATDIGYIKYNTSTNMVTDFLNLTTQNPAIGHVNGLALNPINNNIALALDNGFAIYDGTTVTMYSYTNSGLTVGSVGGSQFTKLEVRYGRQGELYIFKPDVTGYQVFNAGVFDVEVATTIRPQDIIENQAGTKVFFAGSNNGLHELVKATNTWTNYTTSNSDLIYNPIETLYVDADDLLYIGSFQGLNTMDSSGVWNTYQQLVPPNNVWFYPVYEISKNETTGGLLIRSSTPNSASNFGLTLLDLTTNTWTNYTDNNTNCLNSNSFSTTTLGGDGAIYAIKTFTGEVFRFNNSTNNCTQLDINYLNSPIAANSSQISDLTTRTRPSGVIDIGFTQFENLHIIEAEAADTLGINPAAMTTTTIVPSPGQSAFSVIGDNDYFIVENNTGWAFVDGNNNITSFNHNLPDYLAITTKKAAAFDSNNGIINLVHKGFDASWNYRVYKTQCDTATASCSTSEEFFTADRDLSQNIVFGCSQDPDTNQVNVACVKTNTSGETSSSCEFWDNNSSPSIKWNETHPEYPFFDPILYMLNTIIMITFPDFFTIQTRDGNGVLASSPVDSDNDGNPEEVKSVNSTTITKNESKEIIAALIQFVEGGIRGTFAQWRLQTNGDLAAKSNQNSIDTKLTIIPDIKLDNGLPEDLFIKKFEIKQYNSTDVFMVILTNYGLLMKTGIDVSNLTLSTDDASLKDTNLFLYPNPAKDRVSFSDNSIKNITVYDINGRKVLSTTNSNSFSVKTLAQGVYIVKGTNDNNVVVTKKLVVE